MKNLRFEVFYKCVFTIENKVSPDIKCELIIKGNSVCHVQECVVNKVQEIYINDYWRY